MLPSKFGVIWPFGSGEEAKNRFSRWRPWRPSWISDRHDFSYFWSKGHPDASYQVSSQLAQGYRRSRLLKKLLTPHDGWRTTHNGQRTLTDHNSSPWARSSSELKTLFKWQCTQNKTKKRIFILTSGLSANHNCSRRHFDFCLHSFRENKAWYSMLTLFLLNLHMSCLCKQCRSRSVGFWRSQLIWICTVCHQVCKFIATIQTKWSDWLKIRSGCGILIYSAGQGLINSLQNLVQNPF